MAYRHPTGLCQASSRSLPKIELVEYCCSYYVKLCVDCDVLYAHIGCMCSLISSGMYVNHAAAPSAWLDFVLKCFESCAQTVRCLATETFARQTLVCSHEVKQLPGKGKDILKNVFPHYLWFGLSVYPTWCETFCLRSEW